MAGQEALEFEGVDPILSRLKRDDRGYRLGGCRLEKLIGQGGMGRVYRGRHLNLEVPVAVKVLHLASLGSSPRMALDRFKREAKLAALVSHENLIRVYDSGEESGIHYIVMELVDGETSRARVDRKGRLELFEALAIIHGTIKGLRAAHDRQLIHRDIKPGNILISRDAKIKVADLGLAKSLEHSALELTMKGSKLGTPRYAAPEQWQDASEVTAASDVYAVGAVLYFFLTGEDGIQGESALEVIQNTCRQGFPRLSAKRKDLPPEIDLFIAKCSALKAENRFQNGTEMLRVFEPVVRKLRMQLMPQAIPGQPGMSPRAPQPVGPARAPMASPDLDGGDAESESGKSPSHALLVFIGVGILVVFSILLWIAGKNHPSAPALALFFAAAIAVGLVFRRRHLKRRRIATGR